MSLAEQHTPRTHTQPRCSIGVLLDRLDDDDIRWLDDAVANAKVGLDSFANIAATLRSAGHGVRGYTLARHAREDCTCEPRCPARRKARAPHQPSTLSPIRLGAGGSL